MAERNQGPVKPPTIDLVAREAAAPPAAAQPVSAPEPVAGEPGAAEPAEIKRSRPRRAKPVEPEVAAPEPVPDAEAEEMLAAAYQPPPPTPPRPPEPAIDRMRPQADWGQIGAAAVIGALFGTALTYAVATMVPLPSRAPLFDDPAPALADQAQRLDALDQRVAAAEESAAGTKLTLDNLQESAIDTQMSLDATITQLDSGLSEVRQQIATATSAAPVVADTSAIEARLRELSARLDAVAAGASSADAGALAENLSDLEQALAVVRNDLAALTQRVAAGDQGIGALQQSVTALESRVATVTSIPTPPPGPSIGDVALNGLEAAFAAGRPFAPELDAVTRIAPDIAVPAAIGALARTGLPSPEVMATRFAAIVPDMLAASRPAPDAGWQDAAVNWFEDLLALRPSGDVEGDTPEALMARLEGAMERRDFVVADTLFAQLPAEMRDAAGTLPADVALHAQADKWIETLRSAPVEATQ